MYFASPSIIMNACANKSITMLSIRIRLILCACVALHQTSIVTQISVWTVNDKSDLYHEQNYDLNTRTRPVRVVHVKAQYHCTWLYVNFFHEIGEKLRLKVRSAGFFSRVEIFGTKSP